MGLVLGGAQAQPPALQDVDSRGFEPWIDRALDRTHAHDLDWAAHLLLFCAEPKRWLDAVRAERDLGERRPKVRERIVGLSERAARLCQTVREDQLARLPDLAARLAERGHPPQALLALPPPFDDFRRVGDRLAGWEAQLLQHCPASRDAGS